MLAECLRAHPVETRAELQRHFGLNLDDMGRSFSAFHAAACVSCMPSGALLAKIDERTSWTITDVLLHSVVDILCGKHIPFPWESEDDGLGVESSYMDDFDRWYSRSASFKEVDEWHLR